METRHSLALLATAILIACSPSAKGPSADVARTRAANVATDGPQATAPPAPEIESAALIATCTYPVAPGESAASVLERFDKNARRETISGAEGSEFPGIALWPEDPARRVEIIFAEGGEQSAAVLRFGEGSLWQVRGLRVGDDLAKLVAVNGAPISFYGFEWDYGGYVTDWNGGRLTRNKDSCGSSVRLSPPSDAEIPANLSGDRVVRSDEKGVAALAPVISDLSLDLAPDE